MRSSERLSDRKTEGRESSIVQRGHSLIFRLVVVLIVMLATSKNMLVQSFRLNSIQNAARRGVFRSSPICFKLDNRRQFTSSTLSASSADPSDEKKAALKKKTSMLSRASKVLSTRVPKTVESEESSFIIDSKPDVKMTKQVQEDLIADYARSVSRIPTSVKAKKVVVEKEHSPAAPELSKKYTPKYTPPTAPAAAPAVSSNTNSVYTNTEYKEASKEHSTEYSSSQKPSLEDFDEGSDSEEDSFESSQLTTTVTNMAFNSLDVSENTKRALSEVMNYK